MTVRLFLLLLLVLGSGLVRADTLYKCIDDTGVVLYTNQKGGGKNCIVLSQDQPVSTYAPPKPVPRQATPSDFPRVTDSTQKGRDSERRKILEQELATEQQSLDQARKDLAEGEQIRLGNEKNYQKYLDRVQKLKDNVALHERNVEALRREMATLR
ncbi:MAG TPA: DUF4124 domain-containing protein [Rhodocyclaceae bacterium]|nr:DUF4124 domain-containing protein [Rhodocyclaceae bacterium]